ncbi:MAG: oligopeptide ABC transporter permease OppC [Candidatus Symbiodolus clandestinus]
MTQHKLNSNVTVVEQTLEIQGRSLWQHAFRRFIANRASMISLVILLLMVVFLLIAPFLSPYTYDMPDWGFPLMPPNLERAHPFGTDYIGRDLLVRVVTGGRISLMVGIVSALIAVGVGTTYGATAGYLGGNIDALMMRWLEILDAFPFTFFVIVLVTLFGHNLFLIFVAIGMVSWLDIARIVRVQTLSLKQKEFIEAAKVCGASTRHILFRHIVPNVLGIVVVYASLLVPSMILFEAFLGFLGLGVQEPMASWGGLLQEGRKHIEHEQWMLVFPCLFLLITLFCCNFIGDGLRDALDPKDSNGRNE